VDGKPPDLTLTTNGSLLARKAQALKDAGLNRVTVSLDGLDDAVFRRMNDVDFPVADVLAGIEAAHAAGLSPSRSTWWSSAAPTTTKSCPWRALRGTGTTLRFIEYMDVGATNGWRMDEVLPSAELMQRLRAELPLVPLSPSAPAKPPSAGAMPTPAASTTPALGEVGVISSVTQAFCHDCNRARLSTEGKLYLCLFATQGYDLRTLLRGGATDEADCIGHRPHLAAAHRPLFRAAQQPAADTTQGGARRVEMSYIGG
jgi:cyclic pyranopterin phosphate synthase